MTELLDQTTQQETPTGRGYTVLARRYRSTDFDEVVGQEPIARTLKNAIERGRTAHAYLFCGTRGVGKTSMARIFAKALNATDDLSEQDAIAKAILRGEDIDVIEIDGASNRGIDEVRDLIANAGLAPARCRYKIYIIDEVHMLTSAAFNALLKIMEEPPSHVKFVLCTTEPHKVPATIQSRCQRFDFRNIPASRIADHLRDVLQRESIEADDRVVHEVARLANGSMRDGLSLLDRLIAAGEGTLTEDVLEATLGTPNQTLVANVVNAIAAGDAAAALTAAGDLLNHGVSIEQAIEVLSDHLRNVMVVVSCGADSELFELFGAARDAAVEHAKSFDLAAIVYMITLLEAAGDRIKRSATSRSLFDALIVRLALTEQIALIPGLLRGSGPDAAGEKKKSGPVRFEKLTPSRPTHAPRAQPEVSAPQESVDVQPSISKEELEQLKKHPAVERALELFGGKVVDVKTLDPGQDEEQDRV